MSGGKCVVGAFADTGKSGEALMLPKGVKQVPAAGEQFVGIGLMSDIPDDFVFGCIEYIMEGQRSAPQHPSWRPGVLRSLTPHRLCIFGFLLPELPDRIAKGLSYPRES